MDWGCKSLVRRPDTNCKGRENERYMDDSVMRFREHPDAGSQFDAENVKGLA
jgi:hypothetical protein